MEFARILGSLIHFKVPLIYLDESTFHSFTEKTKSWCTRFDRNLHAKDNKRFSSNVFGAISPVLEGKVVIMHADSVKTANYIKFLRLVKSKIRPDIRGKCVLLIDNAPSHTAKDAQKVQDSLFHPLRSVPHDCAFNSIVSRFSLTQSKGGVTFISQGAQTDQFGAFANVSPNVFAELSLPL